MTELKVLRIDSYEGYDPFSALAVNDQIFVDDLRGNEDESLNLVPRITTYAQLKDTFKIDINYSLGRDACPPGELYWSIVGFYLRTGIAAFIPRILGEDKQPLPNILVYAHWPDAPFLSEQPQPNYHPNAVAGFTNGSGDVGFGYSGGAVTGGDGGVYDIWASADPPSGARFYSDVAVRLGWFGGTDHLTPNPIFQVVRKADDTSPPSGGQSELRVFDKEGNFVGRILLADGAGTGGRIALFSDGIERANVGLE